MRKATAVVLAFVIITGTIIPAMAFFPIPIPIPIPLPLPLPLPTPSEPQPTPIPVTPLPPSTPAPPTFQFPNVSLDRETLMQIAVILIILIFAALILKR